MRPPRPTIPVYRNRMGRRIKVLSGTSPFPPLSPRRIEAAKAKHGPAVDQYLEHLRLGDPLADDLTAYMDRQARGQGFRLLVRALDQGIDAVQDAPPELVALFRQIDHVPAWVDWDKMNVASRHVLRNGWLLAMSLAVYAVPHTYLATGNKPLEHTGELLHSTAKRYALTTRFVTEVFLPGGLRRDADGFRIAILTRIMHARARQQILNSGEWDPDSVELPLNQAHMAMGLIFFGYFVVVGMRRLGGNFDQEDMDSILLTWRYVGHLFGIAPGMVPVTEADIHNLLDVAFSLEFDPDDTSRQLCRSLIASAPEFTHIEDERTARLFVKLLYSMSRRMLGNRLADQLGYPKARYRGLCTAWIALTWLFGKVPVLMPRALKRLTGIEFWLTRSAYDMSPYMPVDQES